MTSIALVTVLRAAGRAGVAVCLWGDPGIGKSAHIAAAAAADDVPCEIVIGSLREPSDFAGLPVVTDDGVRLEPPSWAKRLQAAQAGYLFLDELSTSPPAVQAAMLGVALERRIGGWFCRGPCRSWPRPTRPSGPPTAGTSRRHWPTASSISPTHPTRAAGSTA